MSAVRLILALHNHQPVGNFDGVFEAAYRDSYLPFLEVLEDYPEIPFVLHTSGPLMEWLAERHGDYVLRVRKLVEAGPWEKPTPEKHRPCREADRLAQVE